MPAWRERWKATRDRILSSQAFQTRAAANPLTRPIARARARALFDLCAGFVYSQVLAACVELKLFERLAEGPASAADLAPRLGLSIAAAERLLRAAAALDLVEARDADRYGLGQLGAALVSNEGLLAMIAHHRALYADLADPVALLRGDKASTRLSGYWAYASADSPADLAPAAVAPYSRLMALSQPIVADEVLDAYDFAGHRQLLDVGGGEGAFATAAAATCPALGLGIFDLPAVADRARDALATRGLSSRIDVHGGDFLSGPLPAGFDVVTLVRILLDHPDASVRRLLENIHRALPTPGGTLVVAEPTADSRVSPRMGAAYFGFYLMAMGGGRTRTHAELAKLLRDAGFREIEFREGRRVLATTLAIART